MVTDTVFHHLTNILKKDALTLKKIETQFVEQTRWNNDKGKLELEQAKKDPASFVIKDAVFNKNTQAYLSTIGNIEGKSILELGCGRGQLSVHLAQLGADVHGIDIGADLIALADEIAKINKADCTFHVGSIHQLPFEDDSFDEIIGAAILHHLPRFAVKEAIAEAYRVMRPGGRMTFIEPVENSRFFDFLQNMIPLGSPDNPNNYRPSVLNRKKWKAFEESADDRAMTTQEFLEVETPYDGIHFNYQGLLVRITRIIRMPLLKKFCNLMDPYLTHDNSPFKKLGQVAIVSYYKAAQ